MPTDKGTLFCPKCLKRVSYSHWTDDCQRKDCATPEAMAMVNRAPDADEKIAARREPIALFDACGFFVHPRTRAKMRENCARLGMPPPVFYLTARGNEGEEFVGESPHQQKKEDKNV